MKISTELPTGYREILSVDLQKNKKLAVLVNVSAAVIAVLLAVLGHFHISILSLFDLSHGFLPYLARFGVLAVASVAYIVLHELVHGVTMKLFGCPRVKYGFTGLYAFAGSDCYFGKWPYIAIALAPVVLWGIVLGVLCATLPASWFWVVCLVQITNLSGAAGDLYVTAKFLRLPKSILVRDVGVSMTVYAREE
ncbi:MAG: DUF3267 domain-containing protein [Clostridia bacterium]|nr:DUF3267 domain-containing protein [Clostridia bacterium]